MKWKENEIGDTRERSGFLLIPKTIGDETRHLTWAVWEEEYVDDGLTMKTSYEYWKAIVWLN